MLLTLNLKLDQDSEMFHPDVCQYVHSSLCNNKAVERFGELECEAKFSALMSRLSDPPSFTTLRYNKRLGLDLSQVISQLTSLLMDQYKRRGRGCCPNISVHPSMPDCLMIKNEGPIERTRGAKDRICHNQRAAEHLEGKNKEVIVDIPCGMAVMRGADIFSQGILAAPVAMLRGDTVSVYIDVERRCRKGLTMKFDGQKIFVGNGVAMISRDEVFCSGSEKLSGVGISMTEPLYISPALSDLAPHLVFAQNLPSIACVHSLAPQPGEVVIDLCAAPGGKTTHIATLMNDTGRVIAIDKCRSKIETIRRNAANWNLNSIESYCYDGVKIVSDTANMVNGPPYPAGQFDRVLLDSPCSVLGQRPVVKNNMSGAEVRSYSALQKQLFRQAVLLLREGGCLVYSTCTITLEENECIVAWALKTFPQLTLVKQMPVVGGGGWPGSGLDADQEKLVQRFDPSNICSINNECCGCHNNLCYDNLRHDNGSSTVCTTVMTECYNNDCATVGLSDPSVEHENYAASFDEQKSNYRCKSDSISVECMTDSVTMQTDSEESGGGRLSCFNVDTIGFFVAKFYKTVASIS